MKPDGHFDRMGRSITVERAQRDCFDKKVFEGRNQARDWAARAQKRHDNPDQQPYRCHVCGKWHLTKLPKEAQAGARAKDWKEPPRS